MRPGTGLGGIYPVHDIAAVHKTKVVYTFLKEQNLYIFHSHLIPLIWGL